MKMIMVLLVMILAAVAGAAVPPYGAWEWIETEDPNDVFFRPADVGFTIQYDFRADMTFIKYRSQVVSEEGDYWVSDALFHGQTITVLFLDTGGIFPDYCAYEIAGNGDLYLYWGSDEEGWPSFPIERYGPRGPVSTVQRTWGDIKSLFR